jgi:hypothetical protein
MSKSAIKSLNRANAILAVIGLTIGEPANWMTDEQGRAKFENADLLACLIINSAANALQCETADTLDANMYDNMQQAVEGYIQANLDDWDQKEWPQSCRDVREQLARLAEMVNAQLAYNARQEAHAEALELNAAVDEAVTLATLFVANDNLAHIGVQHAVERIRHTLVNLNRYPAHFIVKMMISVWRLAPLARAEKKRRYLELLNSPAPQTTDIEIPF